MFQIEDLMPKLDWVEMKQKMHEDVFSSIRKFLIYMALLQVTPYILEKLDSI
ncbi:mitochondrial import receptor subunit TOM5 homolog [Mus pahari]|uniref:mitochondrial import receptor subunit TOM5 homolog n=1 Tax=Mus pahari TaxID=10093 RepID=UPI000A30CE05|nr:mitochondrial import receptor subunit TOM5 homolog [Mus pahari]